jgi:hypothetical protein
LWLLNANCARMAMSVLTGIAPIPPAYLNYTLDRTRCCYIIHAHVEVRGASEAPHQPPVPVPLQQPSHTHTHTPAQTPIA